MSTEIAFCATPHIPKVIIISYFSSFTVAIHVESIIYKRQNKKDCSKIPSSLNGLRWQEKEKKDTTEKCFECEQTRSQEKNLIHRTNYVPLITREREICEQEFVLAFDSTLTPPHLSSSCSGFCRFSLSLQKEERESFDGWILSVLRCRCCCCCRVRKACRERFGKNQQIKFACFNTFHFPSLAYLSFPQPD